VLGSFVVHAFGEAFFEALKQADLLFCNASEASASPRMPTRPPAFAKLRDLVPAAIVTDGPNGAYGDMKRYHSCARIRLHSQRT